MKQKKILELRNVSKHYPIKTSLFGFNSKVFKAVDDVTLNLKEGETLGIVGESGCGKSTLGKSILRLHNITSGKILFKGQDITDWGFGQMRLIRPQMQMIFQDPYSSLNPRMTIKQTLSEPLLVHKKVNSKEQATQRVLDLMSKVGLSESALNKFPSDFSGGQRQRIAIARALSLQPDLIVADEPVSALDVSIQSQILNLLIDLRNEFGFSSVFISHDLAVVEYICDKVAVIYLGKIVEYSDKKNLFSHPKHPYTEELLRSVPVPQYREKRVSKILAKISHDSNHGTLGCPFFLGAQKHREGVKRNHQL